MFLAPHLSCEQQGTSLFLFHCALFFSNSTAWCRADFIYSKNKVARVKCITTMPPSAFHRWYKRRENGSSPTAIVEPPDRPLWWQIILAKDHPDERPTWWETTLMKDHPSERTPWWKNTQMKDHLNERSSWCQTTLVKNHPYERPPW